MSASLRSLLGGAGSHDDGTTSNASHTSTTSSTTATAAATATEEWQRGLRSRHLQALNDVGHSRSILFQNIVRCIDLWKEANLPLTPPVSPLVYSMRRRKRDGEGGDASKSSEEEEDAAQYKGQQQEYQKREAQVRDDCVELAMRLGIPQSSALLALDVFPEYQVRNPLLCFGTGIHEYCCVFCCGSRH